MGIKHPQGESQMTTEAEWNDAATSQRETSIDGHHQELAKVRKVLLKVIQGEWPCRYLDFRPLSTRIVKE